MNQIILKGIGPGNQQDERTILLLDIHYQGETFEWEIKVTPFYTGTFEELLHFNEDKIFTELKSKLDEWELFEPKWEEVINHETGEILINPIPRSRLVKPSHETYDVPERNSNKILIEGLSQADPSDDRTPLLLKIHYNEESFAWRVMIPPSWQGSFQEYIDSNGDKIYADLESKLQEWNNLDAKTRVIESPGDVEPLVVPITRDEIVKPTYPDYYALRAMEYPPLKEQIGAMMKGGESLVYMQQKIAEIKNKYPKT